MELFTVQLGPLLTRSSQTATKLAHIGAITLVLFLAERAAPSVSYSNIDLSQPSLLIILEAISRVPTWIILVFISIYIFKAGVGAWFTQEALIRRSVHCHRNIFGYAAKFLLLEAIVHAVFAVIGVVVAAISWLTLYQVSSAADKALVLIAALILFPLFRTYVTVSLYFSSMPYSLANTLSMVLTATQRYSYKLYLFIGVVSLIDIMLAIVIPLWILSLDLNKYFALLAASALVTIAVFWLRGLSFEYKTMLLWDGAVKNWKF